MRAADVPTCRAFQEGVRPPVPGGDVEQMKKSVVVALLAESWRRIQVAVERVIWRDFPPLENRG